VWLLKAVRSVLYGMFDFDEAAGIMPGFLSGPLPCSSTVLLADWQRVGV